MNRPLLVVITGRPASGKTTLAGILSRELKCPLISRDGIKEGYVNTLKTPHNQLDHVTAAHIYAVFFEVIHLLITNGVSLVIEAAFQNKLWKPELLQFLDKATIKIIRCEVAAELAKSRFASRLSQDPERKKFHGDDLSGLIKDQTGLFTQAYEPLKMDVPTLDVDTMENYCPDLKEILHFIR